MFRSAAPKSITSVSFVPHRKRKGAPQHFGNRLRNRKHSALMFPGVNCFPFDRARASFPRCSGVRFVRATASRPRLPLGRPPGTFARAPHPSELTHPPSRRSELRKSLLIRGPRSSRPARYPPGLRAPNATKTPQSVRIPLARFRKPGTTERSESARAAGMHRKSD